MIVLWVRVILCLLKFVALLMVLVRCFDFMCTACVCAKANKSHLYNLFCDEYSSFMQLYLYSLCTNRNVIHFFDHYSCTLSFQNWYFLFKRTWMKSSDRIKNLNEKETERFLQQFLSKMKQLGEHSKIWHWNQFVFITP